MSQQTRIDQFFKSIRRSKSNMEIEEKREEAVMCISLSQHTTEINTTQDCEVTMENTYNIQLIEDPEIIAEFKSNYSKETSEDSTVTAVKVKASSNDEVCPSKIRKVEEPTTCKDNVSLANNNSRPISVHRKSTSTLKAASDSSPRTKKNGHFIESRDNAIVIQAIRNMNLARQGVIPLHDFNLEEIYSRNTFNHEYSNINTETSVKYEVKDINLCSDLNSKILLTTIFHVLSNSTNCGYFDGNDLDFTYSIITLPTSAQMLLARLIKRNRAWFRGSKIKYPEIEVDNLEDTFKILASRSICTFDINSENIVTVLELLNAPEINNICKEMKIYSKGNKRNNMQKLIQLTKTKALFPGMKDSNSSLHFSIFKTLGYCARITSKTWDIIDRMITLLMPNQDPKSSMADIFFRLQNIYLGNIVFPNNAGYHFPVFSNKLHLISYIEVKSVLSTTLKCIERKNWKQVQNYGNSAIEALSKLLTSNSPRLKYSLLPAHVKRYMLAYVWLKILSTCIDAFKKDADKTHVVGVLNILLKQNCCMHEHKGKWYTELAHIEMYYNKNVKKTASIITRALNTENLTQVDKVKLVEKVNKILEKKTNLKSIQRAAIYTALNNHSEEMPKYIIPVSNVTASSMPAFRNSGGYRTVWCIEANADSQSYGSVETVACRYYSQEFPKGLHCEGALPIILFFTLFWEELYNVHVPGSFVTPYQEAPGDLFTPQFRVNRQAEIDRKLEIIGQLNSESLASMMEEKFIICKQYESLMSDNLLNSLQLKEVVHCLGVPSVKGICQKLLDNFKLWKSGFPDLFVWNYLTKKCKIIEVKGPRDVLSVKQRLWLEYLYQLGLDVEVCLVRDR